MAKQKSSFEFDAAGWLFWTFLFLVLVGPCLWLAWRITYDTANVLVRIGMGVVSAAVGSGVLSSAVNWVLQRRRKKQRLVERKKAKKRK